MEQKLLILRLQNISAAKLDLNACLRSDPVLAVPKAFGVAAKGLEPCESGRQLEQQRDQPQRTPRDRVATDWKTDRIIMEPSQKQGWLSTRRGRMNLLFMILSRHDSVGPLLPFPI